MSAAHHVATRPRPAPPPPSDRVEFPQYFERYRQRRLGALDFAWAFEGFRDECWRIVDSVDARSVCDVGGGWRPLFSGDDVRRRGIEYTVLDVAPELLRRTPEGCHAVCADVCEPPRELHGRFDLVFSMFVAEHVSDGGAMHRSIFNMLKPGGVAIHVFPTLYYPAFAANKLLPEQLTQRLVRVLAKHEDKFPARYSWCFGPTPAMRRRLEAIGYEVIEYRPFYGTYYLNRVPALRAVEERFSRWAAKRRNPHLSSFAQLQLRKPHV